MNTDDDEGITPQDVRNLRDCAREFAVDYSVRQVCSPDILASILEAITEWPLSHERLLALEVACQDALTEPAVRLVCARQCAFLELALCKVMQTKRSFLVQLLAADSRMRFELQHPRSIKPSEEVE